VLVVPAGERWPGGAIRYAAEDLVGAGAIISYLQGEKSPEALVAEQAFHHARHDLLAFVRGCVSGRELLESGFDEDVRLAAEPDASESAPVLLEGAYSQ
jgi:2-phosphosulfolactate phosphatase